MKEIYLDNAATTSTYKEVAEVAVDIMCHEYGNPSSLHEKGFRASQILEKARGEIASVLGSSPDEVFFTSGGTESNNLAIIGAAKAQKRRGKKIITTQIEHASVLESFEGLEEDGFKAVYIPPLFDGSLDIDRLVEEADDDTVLVSIGMVNSEIGNIAPIAEAAKRVKRKNPGIIFHTDAVQAFGKIPFSVIRLGVDLVSVSGHKIHAPKGVGALYVKKGVRIIPRTFGGGQEKAMRSGTENMPAIAGFACAAGIAHRNLNENLAKANGLCEYFVNKAVKFMGLRINSSPGGTPYICNISVPGYRSETLLHYLADKGIFVSSGSACSKGQKSHVLTAIGLNNQRIDSAIRVSFTPENTTEELDRFFDELAQARQDLIRS